MKMRVLGQSQQFNQDSAAAAAIDLGNGIAALIVVMVTANKTSVNAQPPSAGDQDFLDANTSSGGRKAAIIANNGSTNLHLVVAAAPTTGSLAGEVVVPPGMSWDAPENYQGPVTGWWEGTPTGSASVTEIV